MRSQISEVVEGRHLGGRHVSESLGRVIRVVDGTRQIDPTQPADSGPGEEGLIQLRGQVAQQRRGAILLVGIQVDQLVSGSD